MGDLVVWVPIILSLSAFGFSLVTYWQQKNKDKRDLFIKMHETLIAPDLQMGRRILNSTHRTVAEIEELRLSSPDQYQLVNRSLAMFDILSMYLLRGYVEKELVLTEWGHTLANTWRHAETFIEARTALEGYPPWASLRVIGPQVAAWAEKNPR